jgi:hypothetical protein
MNSLFGALGSNELGDDRGDAPYDGFVNGADPLRTSRYPIDASYVIGEHGALRACD